MWYPINFVYSERTGPKRLGCGHRGQPCLPRPLKELRSCSSPRDFPDVAHCTRTFRPDRLHPSFQREDSPENCIDNFEKANACHQLGSARCFCHVTLSDPMHVEPCRSHHDSDAGRLGRVSPCRCRLSFKGKTCCRYTIFAKPKHVACGGCSLLRQT